MTDEKPIIKATTPNSKKYDTKIDIYTDDPREKHESIHIAIDSDDKSAHIIDTTNGDTEHTDIKCYLTTACMRHFKENFDDNCYELQVLRWFRDNFVSERNKEYYYEMAPIIVKNIEKIDGNNKIYNYIYENVIDASVKAIEKEIMNLHIIDIRAVLLPLPNNLAHEKIIMLLSRKKFKCFLIRT